MAVASVKKIELFVHRTVVDDVLSALQSKGICQISPAESDAAEPPLRPSEKSRDYASELNDVTYLTRYLAPYYKDPVGALARMLGERDDVSMSDLAALDGTMSVSALAAEVRKRERRLTELRSDVQQSKALRQTLSGLTAFTAPLSMITEGSELVTGFLGTGRAEDLQAWKEAMDDALGEDGECAVSPVEKGTTAKLWGSAFYLRSRESDVQDLCLKHGIAKIDLPASLKGTPEQELKSLSERLKALDAEENYYEGWLQSFTDAHMDEIRRMGDYLTAMKARRDAEDGSIHTREAVLLQGWVPEHREKVLKDTLAPFEKHIDLRLSKPTEEDDPPILLENPARARPFEMLTMLYGAPVYGSVDPSYPMMPFFLLFFGMCYADAGYGLVITAIAMYFLKKYRKMPDNIRQVLILLKYCGIATILYGAFTGSWMGDMFDTFPFLSFFRPIKNFFTLIEPMKDPMLVLGISLGLGIVHIFYGLLLAAWDNLRKGNVFAACADQGGWMVLLTGLLIFGAGSFGAPSLAPAGKWMAVAGAAILVLTQGREKKGIFGKLISGALSLYNVTGYLGDVLSYSRLLALGLVGGAVAMIINMMSTLTGGMAFVGWIIALLIFFGGHVFSMVINILGAFVHPLRLQYVEFFGKFYNSGGSAFDPFCYRTEYVNLSDSGDK